MLFVSFSYAQNTNCARTMSLETITVRLENTEIAVYKSLLSAVSPYFQCSFQEADERSIHPSHTREQIFRTFLRWALCQTFQPSASTELFKLEILLGKDVPNTDDMKRKRPGEDTNTHIIDAENNNNSAASEDDDSETSENDDSELRGDIVNEASEDGFHDTFRRFPANHLLDRDGRQTTNCLRCLCYIFTS